MGCASHLAGEMALFQQAWICFRTTIRATVLKEEFKGFMLLLGSDVAETDLLPFGGWEERNDYS